MMNSKQVEGKKINYKNNKNNILIWGNNWIGDVICSLPAVNAIKEKYKDSCITMVVKKPSNEILKNHPSINNIIVIDENDTFRTKLNILIKLRKEKFNTAYILPNSFRSAFMVFFTCAKERIGYNKECRSFLLTKKISPPKNLVHLKDYFLNLIKINKNIEYSLDTKIKIEEKDDIFAENYIKTMMPGSNKLFLACIHPGASKLPRAWNIEKFGKLCHILSKRYNCRFIVIAGSKENFLVKKLQDLIEEKIIFTSGDISLSRVGALIKRSKIFIGNDSGIMHLAASLNVPVVAIFGPDIPKRTGPFGKNNFELISKSFKCSPCRQKFFKDCKPSDNGKAPCIEAINVKDVLWGAEKIISNF